MTEDREYHVALDARSTYHAWIRAGSEDEAIAKAEDLYTNGNGDFDAKGGEINSIIVLGDRLPQIPSYDLHPDATSGSTLEDEMIAMLKAALQALNTAPRFGVHGHRDSYAIASGIEAVLDKAGAR